jgi:hypothetical protein
MHSHNIKTLVLLRLLRLIRNGLWALNDP